jgi:ferredoxin--NADP+ reductase
MHPILSKAQLSPNVTRLVVEAPRIAEIRRPGQFVIVRRGPGAERIPLTIADVDPANGTISLVIQAIGKSTHELTSLGVGDAIQDIAGPLGNPTHLLTNGVAVTSIIGGRSKEWVIYERELRELGEVIVCTDDGSYGRHGFVTEALKDECEKGGIDEVFAIGPVPMMRACSELTRPYGIKTTVSLNSIMIDGTGMCGGCRVSIDEKTEYACVDGPEFDGHKVDFRLLADRLNTYRDFEQTALQRWTDEHPQALTAARQTGAAR